MASGFPFAPAVQFNSFPLRAAAAGGFDFELYKREKFPFIKNLVQEAYTSEFLKVQQEGTFAPLLLHPSRSQSSFFSGSKGK